jgi:hypothetical protein
MIFLHVAVNVGGNNGPRAGEKMNKWLVSFWESILNLLPDKPDEHGLTRGAKKKLREEAARLEVVRDKLKDAWYAATELQIERNKHIEIEIWQQKEKIEQILSLPEIKHSLKQVTWKERIVNSLQGDLVLRFALPLAFAVAAASIFYLIKDSLVILRYLGELQLLVPSAHAATAPDFGFTHKDMRRYFVLATLTLGLIAAFTILGMSQKADARKLAADAIKTILGVYAGMLVD